MQANAIPTVNRKKASGPRKDGLMNIRVKLNLPYLESVSLIYNLT